MGYAETLSNIVENSRLTLKEISDKCKERGIDVAPSYISKLQTKKQAPASDQVNRVLAEVCGGDIEKLLYEAYFEKAPDYMKELLKQNVQYLRDITLSWVKNQKEGFELQIFQEDFYNLSDFEFMKKYSYFFEGWSELNKSRLFLDISKKDDGKSFINPKFGVEMYDDSMEPTIPRGSLTHISNNENYFGNIVVLLRDNKNFLIKRCFAIEDDSINDKVLLTCDNPSYEPEIVKLSDIKIIGTVTSYTKKF